MNQLLKSYLQCILGFCLLAFGNFQSFREKPEPKTHVVRVDYTGNMQGDTICKPERMNNPF